MTGPCTFWRSGWKGICCLFIARGIVRISTFMVHTMLVCWWVYEPAFSGWENVWYHSATEFMTHALWLSAKTNAKNPNLPPSCQCHHCFQDRDATQGKELLSQKSVAQKPIKSTTSLSHPNKRSTMKLSSSHLPKNTPDDSPCHTLQGSITNNRSIITCVHVVAPTTVPGATMSAHLTHLWPILHELVWCKLLQPIARAEVVIDLWPRIVKEGIDESSKYMVTLIGITHNVLISLDGMMPYQVYQMEAALIRGIQQCCWEETRVRHLNLDWYLRTKLDDNRFAVASSAFTGGRGGLTQWVNWGFFERL